LVHSSTSTYRPTTKKRKEEEEEEEEEAKNQSWRFLPDEGPNPKDFFPPFRRPSYNTAHNNNDTQWCQG